MRVIGSFVFCFFCFFLALNPSNATPMCCIIGVPFVGLRLVCWLAIHLDAVLGDKTFWRADPARRIVVLVKRRRMEQLLFRLRARVF